MKLVKHKKGIFNKKSRLYSLLGFEAHMNIDHRTGGTQYFRRPSENFTWDYYKEEKK